MKTSPAGLAFIKRWELCVLHVYLDQGALATIGVGHLLRPGEAYPDGITEEQAMSLLAQDVTTAESVINDRVLVPMTQNQFDALVSFTFNCGTGAFSSSTMLRLLNAGEASETVANELIRFVHLPSGQVSQGLLARREAERSLFLSPEAGVTG